MWPSIVSDTGTAGGVDPKFDCFAGQIFKSWVWLCFKAPCVCACIYEYFMASSNKGNPRVMIK